MAALTPNDVTVRLASYQETEPDPRQWVITSLATYAGNVYTYDEVFDTRRPQPPQGELDQFRGRAVGWMNSYIAQEGTGVGKPKA